MSVAARAEQAEHSLAVSPIALGPFVLVDIKADAAKAKWIDKDIAPPALLDDPCLLYLGQNNQVAIFVACGRTLTIPASKVMPVVLTPKVDRDRTRGTAAERNVACDRLRSRAL